MLVIGGRETGLDDCCLLGKVHVYAVTRVPTHPCSEHMELLACMCGSMVNVVHGEVVLCGVVTKVELDCGPEVSGFFL